VVEFVAPAAFVAQLFAAQAKAEDGVLSTGLGAKAGGSLASFNERLSTGEITWRIVCVKRPLT
jgi:hypothetical protein